MNFQLTMAIKRRMLQLLPNGINIQYTNLNQLPLTIQCVAINARRQPISSDFLRTQLRALPQNTDGLCSVTPKILSSANPALPRFPSSNSCPISVAPCGTRRGGENFCSGCCASGAQSLRASDTSTKPTHKVNDGCPVKLVMTSVSSRKDGTSNRSTFE